MKKLILLFTATVLVSCNKSDDSPSVDPIYGEWYYQVPGATDSKTSALLAEIKQDGTINLARIYAYTDGHTAVVYNRKMIGTFERSENSFHVKYSYETCNPVKEETFFLSMSGDKLRYQNSDNSIAIVFARIQPGAEIKNMAFVEDKNCEVMAKIQKKSGRLPASTKPKSIFDEFKK